MSTVLPDLWNVRDRLATLRERVEHPLFAAWWRRETDDAEGRLASPMHTVDRIVTHEEAALAQSHAFAYLITADNRHAVRSVEHLRRIPAANAAWIHDGHGAMYPEDRADLMLSETVKASANALSWLDGHLDEEQRAELVEGICLHGGRIIHADAQRGCWWGNALNSNWTAVLNSALGYAALVCAPFHPDEAGKWLDSARARITEMLDLARAEAAGVEGPSYWIYCFASIQDLVEVMRNTGGPDLWVHPFFTKASNYLAQFILPDFSGWVNYADTPHDSIGGSWFLHGVASRTGDALAQWLARRIIETHDDVSWKSLLYFDPKVQERSINDQPLSRFFSSVHLATMRSSWEEDATYLFFKGGSNAWSHTHLDLNHFSIHAYGERLAVDPGPIPYSVHYWHSIVDEVSTKWHNCIVVDGGHQRMGAQYAMSYDLEEAGDCYSRLGGYVAGSSICTVAGDASSAYGDTLDRAVREIVYVQPGLFVIHDDLRTRPARVQRNIEWMLHSECPMSGDGSTIVARGERAELRIDTVFPRDAEHKFVEGKTLPKRDGAPLYCVSVRPSWHHKWNVDPTRSPYPHWDPRGDDTALYGESYRFLTVLQTVPTDGSVEPFDLTPLEGADGPLGVQASREGERVIVSFNPSGETTDFGGMTTDATRAVCRIAGERVEWAVASATRLVLDGTTLHTSSTRADTLGP